jgi:hypothetical protein
MQSHRVPAVVVEFVTYSGPGTGCASGTAPGHIGICVCPDDGCQAFVCALKPPHANTTQRTKIKGFITILEMTDWAYAVKHKAFSEEKESRHQITLRMDGRDDCSAKRKRAWWTLPLTWATPIPAISHNSSAEKRAFLRAIIVGSVDGQRLSRGNILQNNSPSPRRTRREPG